MPLSERDKATVRSTLAGVEVEKLPTIRKIHETNLQPHYRRGHRRTRAILMREYAIELIDQILGPDDEDPAAVREAFDRWPHGVTAPPEPHVWDLGADENPPPAEVIGVFDYTGPERDFEDPDDSRWGRVSAPDPVTGGAVWKGYKNGGKVYLDWPELLRRWGPLTDTGSRLF